MTSSSQPASPHRRNSSAVPYARSAFFQHLAALHRCVNGQFVVSVRNKPACRCIAGPHSSSARPATIPPRTESEIRCRCPAPARHPPRTFAPTASPEKTVQSPRSAGSRHTQTLPEPELHRSFRGSANRATKTSQADAQPSPRRYKCRGRNSIRETPAHQISSLPIRLAGRPFPIAYSLFPAMDAWRSHASIAASARSHCIRCRSRLSRTFRRVASSSGSSRSNVIFAG